MDISTSHDNNSSSDLASSFDTLSLSFLEVDWTQLLLPRYLTAGWNQGVEREKKLRFVEAVIFASAVVYLVVTAALPAFKG